MREALLLRHGMTEANEAHRFAGATDVPLSERGRFLLRGRKALYPPAVLFVTSGMRRAEETLYILYGDVPHLRMPDLSECSFGAFEGRTHQELYETEPLYRRWLSPDADGIACPGGESRAQFHRRVARGWAAFTAKEWQGLAVLVAHGGVLTRIMRAYAPGGRLFETPPNGAGYRVRLSPNGAIEAWEDFG